MLHGRQAMPIELLAEAAAGARPLRPRGAPTRRHIISVARRLFAERSFASTGLDAVAAEAGLSRRSLYNHFTDKQELYRAVMEKALFEVAGKIPLLPAGGQSPYSALFSFSERLFELLASPLHMELLCAVIKDGVDQPWLREAYRRQAREPLLEKLENCFMRLDQSGDYYIQDPRLIAGQYLALLESSACTPQLLMGRRGSDTSFAASTQAFVYMFLKAHAVERPAQAGSGHWSRAQSA
jgi:AcrR family transcriptional regulator